MGCMMPSVEGMREKRQWVGVALLGLPDSRGQVAAIYVFYSFGP